MSVAQHWSIYSRNFHCTDNWSFKLTHQNLELFMTWPLIFLQTQLFFSCLTACMNSSCGIWIPTILLYIFFCLHYCPLFVGFLFFSACLQHQCLYGYYFPFLKWLRKQLFINYNHAARSNVCLNHVHYCYKNEDLCCKRLIYNTQQKQASETLV